MMTIAQIVDAVDATYSTLWHRSLSPAPEEHVEEARRYVAESLDATIPQELLQFWTLCDGFGGNGVAMFGPDQVVRTTELYVDEYPEHLMVGTYEDGPLFTWNRSNQQWETLEQGDLDYGPRASRPTFAAVLNFAHELFKGEAAEEW